MLTDLECSVLTSLQDIEGLMASGRWSGMIPTILELGARNAGGELDLTAVDDLVSSGMVDLTRRASRPILTEGGWAAYEYLTRL